MSWALFRWLYNLIILALLPFVFLRLWIRGFKLPAYRQRWGERLGFAPFPPLENILWVHAVSVGEVISAVPLVKALLKQYPNLPLLVTTTTPTGSERAQVAFKDLLGKRVYHCYLPYDFPFAYGLFFARIKPKFLVVMETELWPNLLHACQQRQIPMMIVNGRLSPLSAKRYAWLGKIMKGMISPIKQVAAQSALDAQRFKDLGFSQKKVINTGNIKFDFELPSYLEQEGEKLKAQFGQDRLVWIAASTHEGEEAAVLKIYQALKPQVKNLLLVLVPRHPDRFERVVTLCEEYQFKTSRRSKKEAVLPETDVYLGDTMGEMLLLYAASDVAFVGGSLQPIGGHNLLEPAALGLPVLTGPYLFNFLEISDKLQKAGGALIVENAKALQTALEKLFQNPQQRQVLGKNAKNVVLNNKGALERVLNLVSEEVA